jgi:tyrosyl-tRNA synthetase
VYVATNILEELTVSIIWPEDGGSITTHKIVTADHTVNFHRDINQIKLYYRNELISGDAIRIISAGGFYINHQRVSKIDEMLTEAAHILPNNVTLIRVGKWMFYVMTF